MRIQLTENAGKHIRTMLDQRGRGIGMRIGTRKSGCTGYAYVVDFADEVGDHDQRIESAGITLVVDRDSIPHLDGMTIDFVRNSLLNSGFEFINPNAKSACGCGESVGF